MMIVMMVIMKMLGRDIVLIIVLDNGNGKLHG
jgi:hypothetical protein